MAEYDIPLERRTGNMSIQDSNNGFGNWFKDTPLLSTMKADGNGGMMKSMGLVDYGLSAFNTWNSWNQGEKMYDLAEEKMDFSKDKFWNNYLQKSDLITREKNIANRQIDYNLNTMGMSKAEKDAYFKNQSTDYYKGDRTKEVDGSYTTIGSAAPAKYAGTSTPGTPTSAFAPAAAAAAPRKIHAASQPGSAFAKPATAGQKPKKLA